MAENMNDTVISTPYYTALVRSFQANDDSLNVDGILGPKTKAALDAYISESSPDTVSEELWELALADVGKGGHGIQNNVSEWIYNLRRLLGFPTVAGPWCAVWASVILRWYRIPIKSRGAFRLCENLENSEYGYPVEVSEMVPGVTYLACWKRGRWSTHREAHVAFVRRQPDFYFERIGGNERGDKVRHTVDIVSGDFRKDLIMVVGIK